MIEAEADLLDHPRVDAFDALAVWLTQSAAIEQLPPTEVIVELVAGDELDPVLGGDEAVGVFLVFDRYARRLCAEFRVLLALGAEDDDDEWISRLAGLVHELIHVSQFWAHARAVPAAATPDALTRWNAAFRSDALEDETETEARRITAQFLVAHPRWSHAPRAS